MPNQSRSDISVTSWIQRKHAEKLIDRIYKIIILQEKKIGCLCIKNNSQVHLTFSIGSVKYMKMRGLFQQQMYTYTVRKESFLFSPTLMSMVCSVVTIVAAVFYIVYCLYLLYLVCLCCCPKLSCITNIHLCSRTVFCSSWLCAKWKFTLKPCRAFIQKTK